MTNTIATDKHGFPVKTCTRCGGTGKHSFNYMHLDMCYGCRGTGLMYLNKKVIKAVGLMTAAIRAAKETTVDKLVIGQEIAVNGKWATVATITPTDEACVWRTWDPKGGNPSDPCGWFHIITFADGTTWKVSPNNIIRRRVPKFDRTPFLAMCR